MMQPQAKESQQPSEAQEAKNRLFLRALEGM